ncbi:MAG TPA: UpxY family transcription antiterminator [Flavisolibacter sp.]|nr:UpxY family transcription antiterminator [Flavisolibacter sp.]
MRSTTPQWYAIYTKPKWEKKVAQLLSRKGICNYCPLNSTLKQWHDRKKWVDEPLFTSYVFVRLAPEEHAEVRKTPGVLNFVYWLGKPAVIRDGEIEAIQSFLQDHRNVKVEKTQVRLNDQVKVIAGPLYEREGTIVEVYQKTVKVLLPTLGYALVATISKQHVELAEPVEKAGLIIRA